MEICSEQADIARLQRDLQRSRRRGDVYKKICSGELRTHKLSLTLSIVAVHYYGMCIMFPLFFSSSEQAETARLRQQQAGAAASQGR